MSKRKRILVVDDEMDLREILVEEFIREGFDVRTAANGMQGLEVFKRENPDIVVSDVRMAGGDGIKFAKSMRKLDPYRTCILLITGFADLSPVDAYDFGVDGFLAKPFELEEISRAVRRALLPPSERWNQLDLPCDVRVDLTNLDWGALRIGRGGIYIPQRVIQKADGELRVGQRLHVFVNNQRIFTGILRWRRNAEIGENTEAAYGVEFSGLEKGFRDYVCAQKEVMESASFIPSQWQDVP